MSFVSVPANQFAELRNRLPAQMVAAPKWLVWKAIPNTDPAKKPRKVPYYPSGSVRQGQLDGADDIARLGSFDEALAAYQAGGYAGLGFALGPDGTGNHWQGVDFDGAEFSDLATNLPGYCELSPSGQGYHLVGYGAPFATLGPNGSGVEAYAAGRFLTVTGERIGWGQLTCLAATVSERLRPLHGQAATTPAEPAHARPEPPGESLAPTDQTTADLQSALAALSPDAYELWVRIGLALKGLGDAGRALWLEWSARSAKFKPAEAAAKWDGFQPAATGYAAVFAEAQRQGWQNPQRPRLCYDIPVDQSILNFTANWRNQKAGLFASTALQAGRFQIEEFNGLQPGSLSWRVKGLLPAVGVVFLYGPSMSGKSFLAIHAAGAIRLGRELFGKRSKPCGVLYIASEGAAGVRKRLAGLRENVTGPIEGGFGFVAQAPNLTDPQDVFNLRAAIEQASVGQAEAG